MIRLLLLLTLIISVEAEDPPPSRETAMVYMQRLLVETKDHGLPTLLSQVVYREDQTVSPDLRTSVTEWIEAEQRRGWTTKAIAEHGDDDAKMLVMQHGQVIDPLFVVWVKKESSWKVVWQSEDEYHFIGRERVDRLRQQFQDIEEKFRADRKKEPKR